MSPLARSTSRRIQPAARRHSELGTHHPPSSGSGSRVESVILIVDEASPDLARVLTATFEIAREAVVGGVIDRSLFGFPPDSWNPHNECGDAARGSELLLR